MLNQAPFGKDPKAVRKGFSRVSGFTVSDLMIALAVAAIITSFAVPSYRTILEKRQVTSTAQQLAAFLSSAQVTAVEHNQFVSVNYKATAGNWCFGLRTDDVATTTCDCTVTDVTAANACTVDNTLNVFTSYHLNYPEVLKTATVGDSDTIVFDPVRGLTRDAQAVKLELVSDDDSYALDVEVSVTGRVKVCSNKDANKDVPGYAECSS